MKNNQPTAQIAVNKSVLKLYNGKNVYLSDNQEFGIELFNPTTKNIAAEVYLNDSRAFDSLLVLRPGQRMFLECNPETKRKFKFETYKVEGDNDQVKQAIKNNGKVEVKFYNEKTPPPAITTYPTICNPCTINYPNPWWNQPIGHNFYVSNSGTSAGVSGTTFTTTNASTFGSATSDTFSFADLSASQEPIRTRGFGGNRLKATKTSKELETGRIEAGSASDQKFDVVMMEFDTWAFHSASMQILPHSQKPVETVSPRNYCAGCGLRNRNNWKFCPKCGRNFNS